jgi:hypothetical protein
VADPTLPPAPISAARLGAVEGGWELRETPGFDPSWHGAAVVDRASGSLVGILLVDDDEAARIARMSASLMPGTVQR